MHPDGILNSQDQNTNDVINNKYLNRILLYPTVNIFPFNREKYHCFTLQTHLFFTCLLLFFPSCLMYNKITYRFPLAYNIFVSCVVLFHFSSGTVTVAKGVLSTTNLCSIYPLSTHLHTALLRKWSAPRNKHEW